MLHEIKIDSNFSDAVLSGEKNFEIRYNDRGYQKGDFINFTPINEKNFTVVSGPSRILRRKTYVITYVLTGWGLQDGYVGLGIKEVEEVR